MVKTTNNSLIVWEAGKSKIEEPGLLTAARLLCFHKAKRNISSLMSLFIRALIPFMKAPFSELNSLPKVLPPKSIRLRIKGSTSELGGTKQSFYNTWHLLFGGLSQIEKLHRRI